MHIHGSESDVVVLDVGVAMVLEICEVDGVGAMLEAVTVLSIMVVEVDEFAAIKRVFIQS